MLLSAHQGRSSVPTLSTPCDNASHPALTPPKQIPTKPPEAQPYYKIEVTGTDENLGIGHLRPQEDKDYLWDWHTKIRLPLLAEPDAKPWGWIADGWLIELTDGEPKISPFGTAGMVETGYETPSFIVLETRADGWLRFRYGKPAKGGDGTAWIHSCRLAQSKSGLKFETWEKRFLSPDISPFTYRSEIPHSLRSGPGAEHERIGVIAGNYHLKPVEFRGDWLRVQVTQPSDYCAGPDEVKSQTIEGWIQWRSAEKGPWVWYYTRGC